MQGSKQGAHVLLQTRVKTLDGELGAVFKRWYPDMDLEVEEIPAATIPGGRYNPVNTGLSGLSFRKHLCNNTPLTETMCGLPVRGGQWRLLHLEGASISVLMPFFARFAVVLLPSQITV